MFHGDIIANSIVQVFWPSRAACYKGQIINILRDAAGNDGKQAMYTVKYSFDQSIRTYEEYDLRKRLYNGAR